MKILAVESSAVTASCAVVENDKLCAQSFVNAGLTHSETLLKLISDTLNGARMSLPDIDYLAVSNGPGSFTGIRIGVSTVKGIAFTDDIPCVGVSTLEAIAFGTSGIQGLSENESVILCPVMDARRDQVYNALFRLGGKESDIARLCCDRAISIGQLADELASFTESIWLCGDGAGLVWSKLGGSVENLRLVPDQLRYQTGCGVAMAAVKYISEGKALTHEQLVPIYLRPSQAERELAEKNAKNDL